MLPTTVRTTSSEAPGKLCSRLLHNFRGSPTVGVRARVHGGLCSYRRVLLALLVLSRTKSMQVSNTDTLWDLPPCPFALSFPVGDPRETWLAKRQGWV